MKLSINIASYKRAGKVKTLEIVPGATVWAHDFEYAEYCTRNQGVRVGRLPDALRGNLPRIKNWIMKCAFDNEKADACLMLDDDIYRIGYFEKDDTSDIRGEELVRFVGKYSALCKEWGFYLWGLNVNMDKQCYREYTPFGTVQYVSSSFSCFLKGNSCQYDPRFPLKEDYDMTLQQCNTYRGLLRLNKWHYVKLSAENVGGCGTYRSVAEEQAQFLLLQKKWGSQIVRQDALENSKSHKSEKVSRFDINPVVRVPIMGV